MEELSGLLPHAAETRLWRHRFVIGDCKQGFFQALMRPPQHVLQQRVLVGVVVIERGLGKPASQGQLIHRGAVIAEALEGISATLQQLLSGNL